VTVTADTMAELRTRRDQVADADLVELRLDTVKDPSAAGRAGRPQEAGHRHVPPESEAAISRQRRRARAILSEALALGAEYVDLEWNGTCADLMERTGGRRVILSHHNFTGMPSDLKGMAQAMLSSGAEVVKIANHGRAPRRQPDASRDRQEHARADVSDRDGRVGARVARARDLDGIVLDLCRRSRRRRRAGPAVAAADAG
jgi:hypothetical protein